MDELKVPFLFEKSVDILWPLGQKVSFRFLKHGLITEFFGKRARTVCFFMHKAAFLCSYLKFTIIDWQLE